MPRESSSRTTVLSVMVANRRIRRVDMHESTLRDRNRAAVHMQGLADSTMGPPVKSRFPPTPPSAAHTGASGSGQHLVDTAFGFEALVAPAEITEGTHCRPTERPARSVHAASPPVVNSPLTTMKAPAVTMPIVESWAIRLPFSR